MRSSPRLARALVPAPTASLLPCARERQEANAAEAGRDPAGDSTALAALLSLLRTLDGPMTEYAAACEQLAELTADPHSGIPLTELEAARDTLRAADAHLSALRAYLTEHPLLCVT